MDRPGEHSPHGSDPKAETNSPAPQPDTQRQGRVTVARTLKLAALVALIFFSAATGALYLSIQSIDRSFDKVISIDQPSRDAALKMRSSADQAIVTYLDALVSDEPAAAIKAETAFKDALADYDSLVESRGVEDYSALAAEVFGITRELGASLIADDQERYRRFIDIQKRIGRMGETIDNGSYPASLREHVVHVAS